MRFRLAAAIAATALTSLALSTAAPASPVPDILGCTADLVHDVTTPPPTEPHTPMPYDCRLT